MVYYPSRIDTDATLPPIIDGQPASAQTLEKLRQAILSIEKELGVKPSGSYATVRARLDALETIIGNLQIISLANDLGGTLHQPKVIGIQGRPVSSEAPQQGEVLVWDGIAWIPAPGPGAEVNFAGDLSGGPISQRVVGINQIPVAHGTSANIGQVLKMQALPFGFQTAIHYDGDALWTKNINAPELYKIDPTIPSIIATITLPFSNENYLGGGLANTITSDATHIYVSILCNDGGQVGKLYIIEKATNEIVGLITPGYTDNTPSYIWGVAVHDNHIVVASGGTGTFFNGNPNDTQIDRYSKIAVLAAYPSAGPSNSTIPPTPGVAFRSNMVVMNVEGTPKIYVNSYSGGKIYEVTFNSGPLAFIEVYASGGPSPVFGNMAALNGYLYVGELTDPSPDSPTNNVFRFLPSSFGSGPITTTPAAFGFHMAATNSTVWTSSYTDNSSFGLASSIFNVIDSSGTLIATPGHVPISYGQMAFDGTFIWADQHSASGDPGIDAFDATEGDEGFDHFFGPAGGQLSLVYADGGGATHYQQGGTTIVSTDTLNIVGSGASLSIGTGGRADLTISALPPPGNPYDHLRLIPDSIFAQPLGMYYDCQANRLWVTNGQNNRVVKLNVSGGNPVVDATITLPNGFSGWKIVGDTNYVYVTTGHDGYVFIINKSTNEVVGKGFCGGGSSGTAITIHNIDGQNFIWVAAHDFSGGSVHQFDADAMISSYPNAQFPIQSSVVPNGLIDWEDMCYVGGEGGFLVTGSAGYIYQFCSENDGGSTLFGNYSNPAYTNGVQIGSVTPVHHGSSFSGWTLHTTSLGSEEIQQFGIQNLSGGSSSGFNLGNFTGDIISNGFENGDIWVNGPDGIVWRLSTDISGSSLIATISVPVKTNDSEPFVGMAFDQQNNRIWMADPGHNSIISISTNDNSYLFSWAGPASPQWAKGDVVFDSPFTKTNLVSTKLNQSPVSSGGIGQVNFSETDDPSTYSTKGSYTTIFGGHNNRADGDYNIIVGGFNNEIRDTVNGVKPNTSTIGGGADNVIWDEGIHNTIAGGEGHFIINVNNGTIGGGQYNYVYANAGTVAGGRNNGVQGGDHGFVGGGNTCRALSSYATIGGGLLNHANSSGSTIAGGTQNDTGGIGAAVGGGTNNRAGGVLSGSDGSYSYIAGGKDANASRFGQMAHAGGAFDFNFGGDAQFSRYLVRGEGSGSYDLVDEDGSSLVLQVNHTYAIRATIIVNHTNGSSDRAMHVFDMMAFCIGPNGPTATVVNPTLMFTTAFGPATETVTFSAVDDTIVATINGATTGSRAVCTYEWTEVGGSSDNNG